MFRIELESLQVMIPISLYVTIEIVKLGQIFFIGQDAELYHAGTDKNIHCRALNIPEELGQVSNFIYLSFVFLSSFTYLYLGLWNIVCSGYLINNSIPWVNITDTISDSIRVDG